MQTDFLAAIKQIASERGIDLDEILDAIKQAIRVGFKKDYPEELGATLEVEINAESGGLAVYADKKVVKSVTSPSTQISLEDAQKLEAKLKEGDHLMVEITHTGDFGRVAAQAARQVILQKLRESERESVVKSFQAKMGAVESAVIQRVDKDRNVFVEIFRAVAKMPMEEQIPGEFYKINTRVKVLLKKIDQDIKGKTLIVSRADPDFLKALFELEVPEIASGTVEIMHIAREAGSRSKVAVKSNADGVDPIGSCVGQRGARINAITNELKTIKGEEKIDIIPWDDDIATFIGYAIRPAEALDVKIINTEKKQALIIVDDEHLSLAIGRDGQNVRLAAKLTGWALDIQGTQMFADNNKLSKFEMDEKGIEPKKYEKKVVVESSEIGDKSQEIGDMDPESGEPNTESQGQSSEDQNSNVENNLESIGLSARVVKSLQKAGINSVDELREQADISAIDGVGPKAVEEIKEALAK